MHWLQHHWYRITPLHLVLYPVSLVFRLLVAVRLGLYRCRLLPSRKLPRPVIIIGNISVGGTGKTPLTLALAQQLVARGWKPLIVSRGYRRASDAPLQVTPSSSAAEAGDEPLLMAQRNLCPVCVGTDRHATAGLALAAHPECDVVLCDDGLQHYRLQRDVEIAVIDGARGLGNRMLLPAGPLREPASRLHDVDALVINGKADVRITTRVPRYTMQLSGATFFNLVNPALTATAADFRAAGIHAVAGIGNPQRYFQHLESLGIRFTPHAFPDHHPYCAADLGFPDCAAILLTEKDAVKCAPFADARYWVLRVEAQLDAGLIEQILRKIAPDGHQTA